MNDIARQIRLLIVRALEGGDRGHVGPSMSLVEIMVALFGVMKHDPANPRWPDRDRLVLSKGHGCLALYAALAHHGYFPPDELDRFCRHDALLGGHPSAKIPGVECHSGSLGTGISIAVGMALAAKIAGRSNRVYAIVGDGECQEGQVWEAALAMGKHRLANMTIIVDANGLQSAGKTDDICQMASLYEKFRSFGIAGHVINGHNVDALMGALGSPFKVPNVIVANTVKGKSIPFAEHDPKWHHRNSFSSSEIAAMREALS